MFLRHNLHEYCQFFSHIRWSIEQGRFEEFKEIIARSNFVSWHLLKYVIQSITSLMVYLHEVYSRRNRWTFHESTWQCEHVCDVVQKLHFSLPVTVEKEGKENETAEARSRESNEMQAIQWIHETLSYRQEARPPGFSPLLRREERRVQGLDYCDPRMHILEQLIKFIHNLPTFLQ